MWFQSQCFFYYIIAWYTSYIEKKEHQKLNVLFKPVVAAQKIKDAEPQLVVCHSSCKSNILKESSVCFLLFLMVNCKHTLTHTSLYVNFGDKNFTNVLFMTEIIKKYELKVWQSRKGNKNQWAWVFMMLLNAKQPSKLLCVTLQSSSKLCIFSSYWFK